MSRRATDDPRSDPSLPTRSATRTVLVYLALNCLLLVAFYSVRLDQVLGAVLDLGAADIDAMRVASLGFVLYGAAAVSLLILAIFGLLEALRRRGRRSSARLLTLPTLVVVLLGTTLAVTAFVDTTVFKDYGIHFYEYDVASVFLDAASARDLGIRPQDVAFALAVGVAIVGVEILFFMRLRRVAERLPAATGRVAALALVVFLFSGWTVYDVAEERVVTDRHEFLATLPLRHALLLDTRYRPHVAVEPRLDPGGYPDLSDPDVPVPRITRPRNVVIFLGDGFRADHAGAGTGLTPALTAFGRRPEVLVPRRHYSTSHATETGFYGLLYGLEAYTYHAFLEGRVSPYPLEVLERNGYRTLLLAGTRIIQYPSSELVDAFDEVVYPDDDDELLARLGDFVEARRADRRPYLVVAFFYTPHYPYGSVKPHNQRFQPVVEQESRSPFQSFDDPDFRVRARNSYRNSALQADEYFREVFRLVRDDYEAGRTALLATSDHGTEMWEHGLFGHGRSTFWNEKILVPAYLGLPGVELDGARKRPPVATHPDVWPTLLEYLGAEPLPEPSDYSHGVSLLSADPEALRRREDVVLAGRYFPWANRVNTVVGPRAKYWFHVTDVSAEGHLEYDVVRITDLADEELPPGRAPDPAPVLRSFERDFWRFLELAEPPGREDG